MRWPTRASSAAVRAKKRANLSFLIFVMFFTVFGVIVLTQLLMLERSGPSSVRSYDKQSWDGRTEPAADYSEWPAPADTPLDAVWQPVAGTRYKFFVYSAYVERRKPNNAAIRIIGATKTRGPHAVVCRLWLPNNKTILLKTKVKTIRENWNLRYSATYVMCLLRDSGVTLAQLPAAAVSVLPVAAPHRAPANLLRIVDTAPRPGIEETVHVCVKPFHYAYARDDWLVEWFEMNRLLGVTHFYMYNGSLSPSVECLVNAYKREGLITMNSWKLPLKSKIEIRTEGQFAAFNDCLYRSMSSAGWLLVLDVDELVLPRRERTLPALLAAASAVRPPARPPAAVLFRNAFFYMQWKDDPEAPNELVTARKTRRRATPHSLKNRSKYAVMPRYGVELGNHFLWEMTPGAETTGVAVDRALLHHYREVCEYDNGLQCLTVPSAVDRTAHRWADDLQRRVAARRLLLDKECAIGRPV